jgi:hypothetical protein
LRLASYFLLFCFLVFGFYFQFLTPARDHTERATLLCFKELHACSSKRSNNV